MTITITDLDDPTPTHSTHTVTIYNEAIYTVVTHTPSVVDQYISEILYIHRNKLHRLVVGLDIEWRPSFQQGVQSPVATLQLCVGRRCLIFQLLYTPFIPQSLVDFLNNPTFQFVGVGIHKDVDLIYQQYNLWVSNPVDLRDLAVDQLGDYQLYNTGLKGLAREVLGMEIDKPKRVTLSRWDNQWLTYAQIQYACADAFLSFDIGKTLIWGN